MDKLSNVCGEHLKISVCNTFLHVKGANEDGLKLSRSWSDPSISSSFSGSSEPISSDISSARNGNALVEDFSRVAVQSDGAEAFGTSGPSDGSDSFGSESWSQDETPGLEGHNQSLASPLLSVGSGNHELGTCKPCIFVHQESGCENGNGCMFCHHTHQRKTKTRPCKAKRDRFNNLLLRQQAARGADSMEQNSGAPAQKPTTKMQL